MSGYTNIPPGAEGSYVTLAAPAANLTITGLNGETDGDYEIFGQIISVATAGSENYIFMPNGLATNAVSATNSSSGALTFPADYAFLNIGLVSASEGFSFHILFTSKTGHLRYFEATAYRDISVRQDFFTTGRWTDTTTTVTSFSIGSALASNIDTGSWLKWRRRGFSSA